VWQKNVKKMGAKTPWKGHVENKNAQRKHKENKYGPKEKNKTSVESKVRVIPSCGCHMLR
jgi:hypothetical protein